MVTVGQLMKKELITVDAGTSVIDAAKLMKTCNVCSVLIAEKGRIIGIASKSLEKPIKIAGFGPRQSDFEGAKTYAEWRFIPNGL